MVAVPTLRDPHSVGLVWDPDLGIVFKPSKWL